MRLILLTLHICGGVSGVLSGFVAMAFRKGSRWHGISGNVFAVSMLTMAGCGAVMAVIKNQPSNILAGTLTLYLVATAWMTARRADGKTGVFERLALAFALIVGIAEMGLGIRVLIHPTEKAPGVPVAMYFIFATIIFLAAAGDFRMLARGGVSGTKRIVRHLWRMCFSFFIATGSFFLGQQKVFPAAWRGATIWWVLAFSPLGLLIFWLLRVWFANRWRMVRGQPVVALR